MEFVKHTEDYLTLLRYFDLKEVANFIIYILKCDFASPKMRLERHFESLDDLNMKNIKMYYLKLLQNILPDKWDTICVRSKITRQLRIPLNETVDNKGNKIVKARSVGPGIPSTMVHSSTTVFSNSNNNNNNGSELSRQKSVQPLTTPPVIQSSNNGLLVTTKDSYTLTDGPTIFISDDVEKIAKFCVQQANIPALTMKELMEKIEFNNFINKEILLLETELESSVDKTQKAIAGSNKIKEKDIHKLNREVEVDGTSISEISKIKEKIEDLKSNIKVAVLNDTFIPNKHHHLVKWANGLRAREKSPFEPTARTPSNLG
jgi:hypothetical protein